MIRRGALGFSVLRFWLFFRSVFRFLLQKTSLFRFWWSLRFADFSFFSIWFSVFVNNTGGFSVLVPDVVFDFSYFVLFWVPVSVLFEQHLGSNSCETPKLFRGMRDKINVMVGDQASPLTPGETLNSQTPGGGTWVFFGWVCAARDSKLAPRSRKKFP